MLEEGVFCSWGGLLYLCRERKNINDLDFLYDCDYVINVAAETHVGNSIVDSRAFLDANINGVYNLLQLLKNYRQEEKKKPILLHFSTDEVYGDIGTGSHTEKDILKPSNPYSATKAAGDMLILAWARTYGLNYIILRPTNNYGIGQYIEKLIPKAVKFLSLSRKIPLHNDGVPVRNWLHADDTALAVTKVIESGTKNNIYNICGGFEQSNIDTVRQIIEKFHEQKEEQEPTDFNEHIDFSYSRVGQDIRYSLDDSKLRSLGWEPRRALTEEIEGIVKHYKNNFVW